MSSDDKAIVVESAAATKNKHRIVTRRRFLQGTVATAAGVAGSRYLNGPYQLRAAAPGQQLRVAFVGTGGRAGAHVRDLANPQGANIQHIVAYADVAEAHWKDVKEFAPNAKGYTDWRKMFDNHLNEIDAVIVAVPDHSHAYPSVHAMRAGKAVYCEKPLTWSIAEARMMANTAAEHKVATQMGNQGHANSGNRRVVEWVRGGVIGDVIEVHTWTNRPIWPQGNLHLNAPQAVPAGLNWDAWLGPAPFRDYAEYDAKVKGQLKHETLQSFNWRGWTAYGCGAVGDMGCHTWDCVFWSMNPDYPSAVSLVALDDKGTETFPQRSHFKWEFPAKGTRPSFVAHWYSGGWKPDAPQELLSDPARQQKDDKGNPATPKLPGSGSIFIGTKGKMLVSGDYAEGGPRLIPDALNKTATLPAQTIPRSPGHMQEFLLAAKGEKPWDFPGSNFSGYAGPLTEVMLLGAITEKIGQVDFKIECNPTERTIITKEALALASRAPRAGWEL